MKCQWGELRAAERRAKLKDEQCLSDNAERYVLKVGAYNLPIHLCLGHYSKAKAFKYPFVEEENGTSKD